MRHRFAPAVLCSCLHPIQDTIGVAPYNSRQLQQLAVIPKKVASTESLRRMYGGFNYSRRVTKDASKFLNSKVA